MIIADTFPLIVDVVILEQYLCSHRYSIVLNLWSPLYSQNTESLTLSMASTANHWDIQGLREAPRYIFRVRAVNQIGAGPWGQENVIETVLGPTMLSQAHLPTILASTIPPSVLFLALLFACLYYGNCISLNRIIVEFQTMLILGLKWEIKNHVRTVAKTIFNGDIKEQFIMWYCESVWHGIF